MLNSYTLSDLIIYFIKLGSLGFGGPVALVGYMHRDLVVDKKWISEDDYREGLALSQLAPGPLAAQLAIYIGFVHYRLLGATIAGLAFIIPSFLMVLGIGFLYMRFEGLSWIQDAFYGVGAAVIGIIATGSYKLTIKSIGKNYLLWGIFIVLALVTCITENENIWLILASGALVYFWKAPPKISMTSLPLLIPLAFKTSSAVSTGKLLQMSLFFIKAGAFIFGSGLAIVPFLYSGVVKEYGWLSEQQFLDAVAVAMITPGPVVITVGFIGYIVGGIKGACVAACATFLPCYIFTVIPAPYFKKYGKQPGIKAFIDGVTAAAVGAIAGAVFVLGKRSLIDWSTWGIFMMSVIALIRFKKLAEPILVVMAAAIGILLKRILFT